jgi:hypothetical protein
LQVAERSLCQLSRLTADASLSTTCRWRLQEAELFWAQGELETGKHMMKVLIDDLEKVCVKKFSPPCYLVYFSSMACEDYFVIVSMRKIIKYGTTIDTRTTFH